jgi:hypothetical protein
MTFEVNPQMPLPGLSSPLRPSGHDTRATAAVAAACTPETGLVCDGDTQMGELHNYGDLIFEERLR